MSKIVPQSARVNESNFEKIFFLMSEGYHVDIQVHSKKKNK